MKAKKTFLKHIDVNDETIPVFHQTASHFKKISIRVSREREIIINTPSLPDSYAFELINQNLPQLKHIILKSKMREDFLQNSSIILHGEFQRIKFMVGAKKLTYSKDERLFTLAMPQPVMHINRNTEPSIVNSAKLIVVDFYKKYTMELLSELMPLYLRKMNVSINSFTTTLGKSSWGWCNSKTRRISLNTLAPILPISTIEYLIVHELAHLTHPNHSHRFWGLVADYIPQYKSHNLILKQFSKYLVRKDYFNSIKKQNKENVRRVD